MALRNDFVVFSQALLVMLLTACQLPEDEKQQNKTETPLVSLTETQWKLIGLDGQQVEMPKDKNTQAHFILHKQEQRIAGFSGCNRFFGKFKVASHSNSHGQLHFSALGSTKMACRGLVINEQDVMKVFINQVSYQISGDALTLFDTDLNVLAVFRAA
jgi:heat shock protein HslJ